MLRSDAGKVFLADSAAIVHHFKSTLAVVFDLDLDNLCACIDRVLHQLLHRHCQVQDDLRGADLVDWKFGGKS